MQNLGEKVGLTYSNSHKKCEILIVLAYTADMDLHEVVGHASGVDTASTIHSPYGWMLLYMVG